MIPFLSVALTRLYEEGHIDYVLRIDHNAFSVTARNGWHALALELSKIYDRTIHPTGTGLTLSRGSLEAEYLCDRELIEGNGTEPGRLTIARKVAHDIGITPSYGAGGMARELCAMLGDKEPARPNDAQILDGAGIGYRQVQPGRFETATAFDVSGCYFNLLRRAKGLYPDVAGKRVIWPKAQSGEFERLQEVLSIVGESKLLRNSLWGAMAGSDGTRKRWKFWHGERRAWFPGAGPFRTLGLIVARSAYELCLEASIETNSIHSHTDSVITTGSVWPTAWDKVGLETRCEAQGRAIVQACGAYRVGQKKTKLFDFDSDFEELIPPSPRPSYLLYKTWL